MTDNVIYAVFNKETTSPATVYQAEKPDDARPTIKSERAKLISHHAITIIRSQEDEIGDTLFDAAFCAVLDMYEAYLDAACDLSDAEIEELCPRVFVSRSGFDRRVRIAKIQKQSESEFERGLDMRKKWALDPTLLQE